MKRTIKQELQYIENQREQIEERMLALALKARTLEIHRDIVLVQKKYMAPVEGVTRAPGHS